MWRSSDINRRIFLQCCGAASMGSAYTKAPSSAFYAYVGSVEVNGQDGIEVFRVIGRDWKRVQQIRSRSPVCLIIHPHQRILYAANRVALHNALPQGTIEVFSINRESGELALVQTQALSLSATEPRSIIITPDARYLLAAVYGGGSYNALPIQHDGTLGSVQGIFKELGCGLNKQHQAAAHPHTLLFDGAEQFLLSSDFGCDRLSVFALNEAGEFTRRGTTAISAGAAPGFMVRHPGGSLLYVMHQLEPAISCHRYSPRQGVIHESFQTFQLPQGRQKAVSLGGGLTIDSNGRFLYATSPAGVLMLAIDPGSGALSIQQEGPYADSLHLSSDDRTLYALDQASGSILSFSIRPNNGKWDNIVRAASVASPVSLAVDSGRA